MRAIVSLGSNLGDREANLSRAIELLSKMPNTALVAKSSILETEPVDVPQEFEDLRFLNQVAIFESSLAAEEFSRRMHAIEDALGRVRTLRNGPRTIDIDLIDYGGIVMDTPELTLPHPRAKERDFVMLPLKEIELQHSRKRCLPPKSLMWTQNAFRRSLRNSSRSSATPGEKKIMIAAGLKEDSLDYVAAQLRREVQRI